MLIYTFYKKKEVYHNYFERVKIKQIIHLFSKKIMRVCVENRVHFPFVGYRRLEKGEEMKGENLPKEFEKN